MATKVILGPTQPSQQPKATLGQKAENLGGRLIGDVELVVERPVYKITDYDEQVSAKLWRGSRLEPGEIEKLKAAGFRGFVDLRAEAPGSDTSKSNENWVQKELASLGTLLASRHDIKPVEADVDAAKRVGVNALSVPIVDNTPPTVEQMVSFLQFATKKENQPVYVHCEAGKGRTGVAVAVYRMAVQGWSVDDAINDGIRDGLGLQDQQAFIRKFGDLLKEGKVPGFPLNPPEPSVAPSRAPAWMAQIPTAQDQSTVDTLDQVAKDKAAQAAKLNGAPQQMTGWESFKQKVQNAAGMLDGVPTDEWGLTNRIATFISNQTSPDGVVKEVQAMSQADLQKLSDEELASLATHLSDDKVLDNLPILGASKDDLGKQLVRVLTAKCEKPSASPLSDADQGAIDAVVSRMPLRRQNVADHVYGSSKAEVTRLLQRHVTAGNWAGFQTYTNHATGTVQRDGTKVEPLIDGGLVPQGGRPRIPQRTVPLGTRMAVENPNGAFPTIFRAIDAAKAGEPVFVTEFAIQSDDTGRQLEEHLLKAKARGCDVRVMYDPNGSKTSNGGVTNPSVYAEMRKAGIPVVPFPDGTAASHLTHRKIIVAGQTGFIGGMNIGDEYSAIWHDCHSKVTGPGVGDLMSLFTTQWNTGIANTLARGLPFAADQARLLKALGNAQRFPNGYAANYSQKLTAIAGAPTGANAVRIVGHIGQSDLNMKLTYLRALATASKRVFLKSPYASDPDIMQALIAARKRGVEVTVMYPETNDVTVEEDAIRGWYKDMLDAGINVYEYKARSMDHGKVAVFDDVSTIGSSNVDARSLHYNDEANEWSSDAAGAEYLVENLFKKDMQPDRSDHITFQTVAHWTPAQQELYLQARKKAVVSLT